MEKEPQPEQPEPDEITLVIRGIAYSLQQNILPRSEAVKKLKSWYPEADIQPKLSDLDYNE